MTVTVPPLPTPPQSTDPQNFAPRADVFLVAMVAQTEAMNAQNAENNRLNASTVVAATNAANSEAASSVNASLAAAAVAAPPFNPTTTYVQGDVVWSLVTGRTYRRNVAGKASADPSADITNWVLLQDYTLPVGNDPAQVPANQNLGRLAFMDTLGVLMLSRNQPAANGSVWVERVSDTSIKLFLRGDDGVARSTTLTLS